MRPAIRGSRRSRVRQVVRCVVTLALGAACLAPGPAQVKLSPAARPRLVTAPARPWHLPMPGPPQLFTRELPEDTALATIDRGLIRAPEVDPRFVVSAPEVDPAMILAPRVQGRPVGSPVFLVPAP